VITGVVLTGPFSSLPDVVHSAKLPSEEGESSSSVPVVVLRSVECRVNKADRRSFACTCFGLIHFTSVSAPHHNGYIDDQTVGHIFKFTPTNDPGTQLPVFPGGHISKY